MRAEKIITLIVAILIVFGIIYMAMRFLESAKNGQLTSARARNLEEQYVDVVSTQTDANKLVGDGINFIRGNQFACAEINLERATVINPNYRDAWVWLGDAQLKQEKTADAVKSLKTAEKIDPSNPQTYQFLAQAYQANGDEKSAKAALEKYNLLTKKK